MNCFDCGSSVWCQTWGELKCIKKKQRMYRVLRDDECKDFNKRTNGHIMDNACQCEDCLSTRGEEQ